MRRHDSVAFGIECDGADVRPITGVSRPTGWMTLFGVQIHPTPSCAGWCCRKSPSQLRNKQMPIARRAVSITVRYG